MRCSLYRLGRYRLFADAGAYARIRRETGGRNLEFLCNWFQKGIRLGRTAIQRTFTQGVRLETKLARLSVHGKNRGQPDLSTRCPVPGCFRTWGQIRLSPV